MGAKTSVPSPKDIEHNDSLRELEIRIKTAEATTKKAEARVKEAEAKANEAEAKANEAKAKANEAKAKANKAKAIAKAKEVFVTIPYFLACDYFFRGTRQGRKLLVKSVLFSTRFKPPIPNLSPTRFISHSSRENVVRHSLSSSVPTMIIGPTGCGKSVLLAEIQRDFILKSKNIFGLSKPSVFLALKNIGKIEGTNKLNADIDGNEALLHATHKLCIAIGYPRRLPLISRFFDRVTQFKVVNTSYVLQRQIQEALSILFESMADSGGLIIVDDVLELLRDDRLKKSGGDRIFYHFATLIVSYMVNFSQVKGAFAGSSNFLNDEFSKTVACDFRWHREYISDLPEKDLLDFLTRQDRLNLKESVAKIIVEKCGTRFRIINTALLSSSTDDDILKNVDNLYKDANQQLEAFLQLAVEYDKIPKLLRDMLVEKQHLSSLPEKLQRQELISKLFYVGPGSELTFQNKIMENLVQLKFSPK